MYCANCGSPVNGSACSVCGATTAIGAPVHGVAPTPALAGWWRRVGATFADDLILVIPTLFVLSLFAQLDGNFAGDLAGLLLEGAYMVKLLGSAQGQTLGNKVAATRVRDALSGGRISLAQALKRWGFIAAYGAIEFAGTTTSIYVVALIALVDNLYPLLDARNQTLHDKFAGTIVVRV